MASGKGGGTIMKRIILVVDDDKSNLMVAQKLLSEEYRVAAVNSGELALKYLEKNEPELILLDIQMPGLNGFEVMEKVMAHDKWCKIPVIFLTADRSEATEEKCFKMGAVDYIGKPFVPAIMLQRIRRTLELEDYRKNLEKMVAMQLKRITQLQQDIIITMANLIESRDGTTGEHVKRSSEYLNLLVRKLLEKGVYSDVLTPTYVDYLCKAAPMHDIGKITVSDVILQKPEALDYDEYELMKQHAAKGGELIRDNMGSIVDKEFVDIAGDVAAYHHEKWDGSGYPDGLKGEEIPLSARIMAVADVFDALVAKRQYKTGMSLEEAFGIMKDERGIRFEPVLLDVFFEAKDELAALLKDYESGV